MQDASHGPWRPHVYWIHTRYSNHILYGTHKYLIQGYLSYNLNIGNGRARIADARRPDADKRRPQIAFDGFRQY